MKRWTSKKSLWPILATLGCLFVLAIFAPSSWHRYRSRQRPLTEVAEIPQQEAFALSPSAAAPLSISADDINKVSTLSVPLESPDPPIVVSRPSAPSANLALNSPRSAEPVPAPPQFDFDVLLQMRDTLTAFIDRLPVQDQLRDHAEQPVQFVSEPPRRQVQVSSEDDRLAMLDTRERRDIAEFDSQISASVAQAAEKIDYFGEMLLDAARRFQASQQAELRIAKRPSLATEQPITSPAPPVQALPLVNHRPQTLLGQLKALKGFPQTSQWAEQVTGQLHQLTEEPPTAATDPIALLQQLQQAADEGHVLASGISQVAIQQDCYQASQSLQRRLGIYRALLDPQRLEAVATDLPTAQPNILPVLTQVAELLATDVHGNDWREYLMLDRLASASSESAGLDAQGRGKLAQEVLLRMSDERLSEAQAQFLATSPLADLNHQLQAWTAQAIDLDRFAAIVERYEVTRELHLAAAIAQVQQQLQWSDDESLQALAEHLDQHYRSSNMRIALSRDLFNRMVPSQGSTVSPVRERIAGSPVRGKARTTTNLKVRLLPDPESWRLNLEAFGKVYSNTRSETWPARVRNSAKMEYEASKTIVIDQEGLDISPAKATAKGRHDLLGVESQLDPIPLFGTLLREIARNQNRKARPLAMAHVKSKVARQARQRMNQEADAKLTNLEQKFRDSVLVPMSHLALIADPIAMFTTEERAVMRLRLANEGQLGAHTPRPLAPADSLASMQMHETALNNGLAGLELEGRRMKVDELFLFLADKLGFADPTLPDDLPARAIIEFAPHNAILVNCEGDHLTLILNIRELAHGRDKIKNFKVHARFRPQLEGLDVRLVRDGTLQFSGYRLKTGPRVVLHSVIGKLFPKDQQLRLTAVGLQDDPRMEGLMVTQLVIDDGWIGLAVGPASAERNAWRSPGNVKYPLKYVR